MRPEVIVFLLLQAFLIQGSFMTSQADSSHPDFNEDSLPELRREPNPPVPFWFQQQLEPPPGIMSDKHSRITYAGSSLCFKFFKDSHYYSRRILPLGGAYTKFADPEIDAFLDWTKLSWAQLVLQSKNFKLNDRVAKDFSVEKTRDLLLRMKLTELVQLSHAHFQSEPLCSNDDFPNMLCWKRFAKEMEENRRFNIELKFLLGKLGVELQKYVAKKQGDVNALEERFSAAHMQLRVEFLDLSSGSLRHLFESDGMNSLLDRAVTGRPRGQVPLTPMELNTVKKIKRGFLGSFEISVYKVFAERLYQVHVGPPGFPCGCC